MTAAVRLRRDGDGWLTPSGRWSVIPFHWGGAKWAVCDLEERHNFAAPHGIRHYRAVQRLADARAVIAALDPAANDVPGRPVPDVAAERLRWRALVLVYAYGEATEQGARAVRCGMLLAAASGAIKAYAAVVGACPVAVMSELVAEAELAAAG